MKKIYCNSSDNDFIHVTHDGEDVFLSITEGGWKSDVYLSPEKIRKLRKQLKKALREIEGTDQQEDEA